MTKAAIPNSESLVSVRIHFANLCQGKIGLMISLLSWSNGGGGYETEKDASISLITRPGKDYGWSIMSFIATVQNLSNRYLFNSVQLKAL